MLTGRPEEEMPASAGDLLQDLSQLHEQARQVMQGIAQALWPSTSLPKGMGELVDMLKGARWASGYGRYQPADKVHGKPGLW